MKNTVLIISNSQDVHSDVVEDLLTTTGTKVVRFNTDKFITDDINLSFFREASHEEDYISVKNVAIPLSSVRSVWCRRPTPLETIVKDPHQRAFAVLETQELLKQLYFSLTECLWVSSYASLEYARRKYPQLKIAQSVGFTIPPTLITNLPHQVQQFFQRFNGKIIYKTLAFPLIKLSEEDPWGIPTSLISEDQLKSIDLIRHTGGIFQPYIEKQYEVRVTVISDDVFAAKIDSQANLDSKVDWRDGVAYGEVDVTNYELPSDLIRKCRNLVKAYKLQFGAIDLIRTPEGEYIFLEINCNGQWLWIEELTGQPLIKSMANLLAFGLPE